ncbi:Auxin efflux carrier component 1 [Vitis vinifera]|uniref:Auxin efflux carrier component 1 n=1 Tax=Vitis vinifera TaxID=29760 RepID=A0A438KA93_VITVI|nr:Auxin efflux carrier component 1 [Vitis vinifera]
MISLLDFYHVMTAVVPLYVAMILAYGSVKWWKIFTPDQCSGINRFVCSLCCSSSLLPLHLHQQSLCHELQIHSCRYPSEDYSLAVLAVWSNVSKRGCLEWTITLFSLSTLPNTLCIIWYTLMLFLFEYRGAKMLISEQFPDTAGSIVSIHVDSDIMSLDGRQALETEAEIKEDGKLHVTVRKSNASRSDIFSRRVQFQSHDFYSMVAGGRNSNFGSSDVYGPDHFESPTPRPSNYEEDGNNNNKIRFHYHAQGGNHYPAPNPGMFSPTGSKNVASAAAAKKPNGKLSRSQTKELGIFICLFGVQVLLQFQMCLGAMNTEPMIRTFVFVEFSIVFSCGFGLSVEGHRENQEDYLERDDFSFGNRVLAQEMNNHEGEKVEVQMPAIIEKSIAILSDAGLGMAMFSLVVCGVVVMALIDDRSVHGFATKDHSMWKFHSSFCHGREIPYRPSCHGSCFHCCWASRSPPARCHCPGSFTPRNRAFVFAKEYNVHPDILSTGVIFGMLIACPLHLSTTFYWEYEKRRMHTAWHLMQKGSARSIAAPETWTGKPEGR